LVAQGKKNQPTASSHIGKRTIHNNTVGEKIIPCCIDITTQEIGSFVQLPQAHIPSPLPDPHSRYGATNSPFSASLSTLGTAKLTQTDTAACVPGTSHVPILAASGLPADEQCARRVLFP